MWFIKEYVLQLRKGKYAMAGDAVILSPSMSLSPGIFGENDTLSLLRLPASYQQSSASAQQGQVRYDG